MRAPNLFWPSADQKRACQHLTTEILDRYSDSEKKVSYVGKMSTGCLTTGLYLELTARVTPCGQLMRASPPSPKKLGGGTKLFRGCTDKARDIWADLASGDQQDGLDEILESVRPPGSGYILVPLDKDVHRRARSSVDGYPYRLAHCYFEAPKHYKVRDDLCPDAAAIEKAKLIIYKWLGPERATVVLPSQLPMAYHTIKGKCLDKSGTGLSCKKDHAHEREIVANAKDPAKRTMALAARALRLAKKLSHEPGWTLWNQAELPFFLRQRLSKLKAFPEYVHKCAPVGEQSHVKRHVLRLMHPSCSRMLRLPEEYNEQTCFSRDSRSGLGKPLWRCEEGPGLLDTYAPEDRRKMELLRCVLFPTSEKPSLWPLRTNFSCWATPCSNARGVGL